MTDKDKVINGLTHCTAWNGLHACQPKAEDDCPYEDELDCKQTMMEDALAMLKEQESVLEALKSDLNETLAVLSEQPEIVRCRECKYGCLMANGKVYMCESPKQNEKICLHVHKPEWFCANGERKDDG